MRRWLFAVLTIPLLLFAGCSRSNSDEQTALKLRGALQEAGGCRFVSEIHADCGGRLYAFTLEYASDETGAEVLVTAPETVAGVCARVTQDGTALEFEDLALELSMGDAALNTPLLLPHLLAECLRSAYIANTAETDAGTAVRYCYGYDSDRLEVEVVLDRAALVPLTCEVFWQGQVICSAEIRDFALADST